MASYDTDRVLTLPNVLSLLRLVGVPVFGWLVLSGHDLVAVSLLALAGASDWLDGHLARRWHQTSRVGQMLDPAADRLYILTVVVTMAVRGLVPWWLVVALLLRDLMLVALVPLLRRRGWTSLPVHLMGKAGTFCLLYAFPLVLLAQVDFPAAGLVRIIGWAFAAWGVGLYWWAGIVYVWQTRQLLRRAPV
ncbi:MULTISPECIES: CDP-alcohol phosphatidyltransferase family protein [Aestuariimicrobium]|uniref:CDP-alcohol phosphatidyltransferase family protein n=1 Tax=Aestuariimicrobium TaxID=396388 RepID=UPI0003B491DF|nr:MULTISPECIES: CDP-alcohol phosphatidyltransferase family protein [Aestuariimicrobium]CAI9408900.1 Putative cardiolipin synthase [Aestuariimicrobium sp. T2.26MG-19.2B]